MSEGANYIADFVDEGNNCIKTLQGAKFKTICILFDYKGRPERRF